MVTGPCTTKYWKVGFFLGDSKAFPLILRGLANTDNLAVPSALLAAWTQLRSLSLSLSLSQGTDLGDANPGPDLKYLTTQDVKFVIGTLEKAGLLKENHS